MNELHAHDPRWFHRNGQHSSWLVLLVALLALPLAFAQDEEAEGEGEGEEAEKPERDLRPARERHALETALATGRWQLEFDYDAPASVVVEREDGTRDVVWYMTFSVRNPHDRKVPLRLSFTMTTDVERGKPGERHKLVYNDGIDAQAEALVEARLGAFENSVSEMRGKHMEKDGKETYSLSWIEPGELRKGIAIFGAVTAEADEMIIDVKGLVDPLKYERTEVVIEVKVLRISYYRPGDRHTRQLDILEPRGKEWVITVKEKKYDRKR